MRVLVALVLGGYLLVLLFLNIPTSSRHVASGIADLLSDQLKTKVVVDNAEIGLFNSLTLRDVCLFDQGGDTLLRSGLVSAKIEFLPLLKKQVSLRSVALLDADIVLRRDSAGAPTNFQFVIDAFKPKENAERRAIDLRINSIILRRCNVSFDAAYLPKHERLDLAHLRVSDLNANVSLKRLTPDSVNIRVRSLSLKERSGLDIRNLAFRFEANKSHCVVSRFALNLPASHIEKKRIEAHYDKSDIIGTMRLGTSLEDAVIATEDVVCLVPQLRGLNQSFALSAHVNLTPGMLSLKKIAIVEEDGNLRLRANVFMGRGKIGVQDVAAAVDELRIKQALLVKTAEAFAGKPLPPMLGRVGDVEFDGRMMWRKDSLLKNELHGKLLTGIGQLGASLQWRNKMMEARLNSSGLQLHKLDERLLLPKNFAFHAHGRADWSNRALPRASVDVEIDGMELKGYAYSGISAKGNLKGGRFDFDFDSRDKNFNLTAKGEGRMSGKRLAGGNIDANVRRVVPQVLGFTDFYGDAAFSGAIAVEAQGKKLEDLQAKAALRDFAMKSSWCDYGIEKFDFSVNPVENGSRMRIDSDFLNARFEGRLSLEALKTTAWVFAGKNLKGLGGGDMPERADDVWRFKVDLEKSDFLQNVCRLPLDFKDGLHAEGNFRADGQRMSVAVHTDGMTYNHFGIDALRAYINSENWETTALFQARKRLGKSDVHFVLEADNAEGALQTSFSLNDGDAKKYYGKLSATTAFSRNAESGALEGNVRFAPTTFVASDTTWHVASGIIAFDENVVDIDNFSVRNARQSLVVDGNLSRSLSDSIHATLNNINVGYVLSFANLRPVEFAGTASGTATLRRQDDTFGFDARLGVPDFHFNKAFIGSADIKGWWDAEKKSIDLDANIVEEGVGATLVKGYVSPPNKELELNILSNQTNIALLRRYTAGIFDGIEGRTTGWLRLFGKFKELDFEGEEVADLKAKIVHTGVEYSAKGAHVSIKPGQFAFRDVVLKDGRRGTGIVNGALNHEHLKNLTYKIDINCDNMLCYDMPKEVGSSFYSTTYGSGSAEIKGAPGNLGVNITIRPERGTTFTYSIDTPAAVADNKLLTYGKVKSIRDEVEEEEVKPVVEASPMNVDLKFTVHANPNANIRIIMDEKAGDDINASGSGTIEAHYNNKSAFLMYGPFKVERGRYKLSVQELIRKDFDIKPGGTVIFNGNPLDAELDLSAAYTVPAVSLSDLNIGSSFRQNKVRVDCLLKFNGKVSAPQIEFDLDLPTVSEDEKQMVRRLISSEDDMSMQILYLLGIGRFYTYNYNAMVSANRTSQSQSATAVNSFLSNTLSSQLNDIISSAMGPSNWSFGTNLSTGVEGWNDVEVAGLLSGRLLNNRLLINGNFGYRDRTDYNTNFVGDFDIRYLLTPTGNISLKAYSETNDRYFTKSTLTTQGVGILLSRDFSNLRDLFRVNKRKKEKEK